MDAKEKIPQKVEALYKAVQELIEEGADVNRIKVVDITDRAGIGKGTAYEYFSNKEELISSAILYQMNALYSQVSEQLSKKKNFEESIYFVLNLMDEEIGQRDCFLRAMHILTDNGAISKKLRQDLKEQEKKIKTPLDCVEQMILIGKKTGEIQRTLPENYLCLSIASKLVSYGAYIAERKDSCDCNEMQRLICDGLLREFSDQRK